MRISKAVVGATLVAALSLSACATKGSASGSDSSKGGIATDYGVTASTIKLGALVDNTGPFKDIGISMVQGSQIWADEVNAAGGICNRKVELVIRDTANQADKAVTLYAQIKDQVAAMEQLHGSPSIAALKSQLVSDNMLTIPASLAASSLAVPVVRLSGPTYAIEIINGLAYLQKQGLIGDGDTIGHVYVDSEFGQSGLKGSDAYAKAHKLTVKSIAVTGTDSDMSAAVTKLKSEGVKAVVLTTTSQQLGSIATQMAAQGMGQIPILGNGATWAPQLLDTPAATALGNYYAVTGLAPFGADTPTAQKIAKAYNAKYTEAPNASVNLGYVFGLITQAALEKACKDKDLTRAGIVKASANTVVDTDGLTSPLDYSKQGQEPARETYVEKVDVAVPGGLKVVEDLTATDEAKSYDPVTGK